VFGIGILEDKGSKGLFVYVKVEVVGHRDCL